MTSNIIKIDLAIVDREIDELREQIAKLNNELQIRVQLKNYATINSIGTFESNTKLNGVEKETKENAIKNGGSSGVSNFRVSDFILKFLSGREAAESKDIILAYAEDQGKTYSEVRNNVSNALSRLKYGKKIESNNIEGSNGRTYYLKENRAESALLQ
jgi:hypothetical protein